MEEVAEVEGVDVNLTEVHLLLTAKVVITAVRTADVEDVVGAVGMADVVNHEEP